MNDRSAKKEALISALLEEEGIGSQTSNGIPRRIDSADAPLSFAQERFWFLNQLEGGAHYNDHLALHLEGVLDLDSLERSINEIVRRHEVLRTTFHLVDGVPVQRVGPPRRVELIRHDVSDEPEDQRLQAAGVQAAELLKRPFDLEEAPAYRWAVWRLGNDDHLFVLCINQIVNDGWSLRVLTGELVEFYKAFSTGREPQLPELPIQYADFASWQRETLDDRALSSELDYWRDRLQGAASVLELPSDRSSGWAKGFEGARFRMSFPGSLLDSLRDLAEKERASLFMVLLSAFKVLIHRYTERDDITVGFPSAGRDQIETEQLIGVFINPLVIKSDLADQPTFRQFLSCVRETALDAYANQKLPFERLVRELEPDRNVDTPPIFQVLFDYNNVPMPDLDLPGLRVTQVHLDAGTSKFDLSLELTESESDLSGFFEYRTGLFSEGMIRRMSGHFRNILEAVAEDPDREISKIPLLSAEETRTLLEEWNLTAAEIEEPVLIHKAFELQVERTPGRTALIFEGNEYSYEDLNSRANRIAHTLLDRGIASGSRIGVCLDRTPETVSCLLGIFKAGCHYVPLDPNYPEERLRYMIDDADIEILLTESSFLERLPKGLKNVLSLDRNSDENREKDSSNPGVDIPESSPAYLIYTSGSTGRPKGVFCTHRGAINRFQWMWKAYPFEADEVCCQKASLNFADSVWEMFGPLLKGVPVVIAPDEKVVDPDLFVALLADQGVTRIVAVPSYLDSILEGGPDLENALPRLRYCVSSGEALSVDLARRFLRAFPDVRLINLYGSSEVSADSTFHEVLSRGLDEMQRIPLGRPIQNTQVYILDKHLQPVPIGVPGELYVGGEGVSPGYHERQKLTSERFVPDPFRKQGRLFKTGDLARYRPDGEVEYLGRTDDQVKVRGMRVEPGEIESALREHRAVREAVVVQREVSPGNSVLTCYSAFDRSAADDSDLKNHLRQSLPEHMIPGIIVHLDEFPSTPSGKIDRRSLRESEQFRPKSNRSTQSVPRNEIEQELVEIWQRLLGRESVGITESFFDLGGHSLLAVRLFYEIEKRFQKKLSIATLFHSPTIEELAVLLWSGDAAELESSLVPIQPLGSKPPFFCVHAAGGNVLFYRDLARRLGEDQPFYGLQARRIGGRQVAHSDLRQMAAYYIDEIRKVQPSGPYYLGGASFGGMAAFEMAQQLLALGEEVALIALFDTRAPGYPKYLPESTLLKRRILMTEQRVRHHFEDLRLLERGSRWPYLSGKVQKVRHRFWRLRRKYRDVMRDEGVTEAGRTLLDQLLGRRRLKYYEAAGEVPDDYRKTEGNIRDAYDGYVPERYPGKVTLFRATNQTPGTIPDDALGWRKLAENLDIHEVKGYHGSIIAEPHVRFLIEPLEDCLERSRKCFEKSARAAGA